MLSRWLIATFDRELKNGLAPRLLLQLLGDGMHIVSKTPLGLVPVTEINPSVLSALKILYVA